MDRRTLIKTFVSLAGAQALPLSALMYSGSTVAGEVSEPKPFSYAWLKGHARALAGEPWVSHEGELPGSLKDLSWDDYQAIGFRPEEALWRNDDNAFQVQLFHLGLYFKTPVRIHEVEDGEARELAYKPEYFRYEGEQPLGTLP